MILLQDEATLKLMEQSHDPAVTARAAEVRKSLDEEACKAARMSAVQEGTRAEESGGEDEDVVVLATAADVDAAVTIDPSEPVMRVESITSPGPAGDAYRVDGTSAPAGAGNGSKVVPSG